MGGWVVLVSDDGLDVGLMGREVFLYVRTMFISVTTSYVDKSRT